MPPIVCPKGRFPSIDFHSIQGPFVSFFPALGLHAGLPPSAIFAFGSTLTAAVLLLAAWLTMFRRFSLPAAVVTLFFLWLTHCYAPAKRKRFYQRDLGFILQS